MFLILCVGLLVRLLRVVPEEAFHHLSTLSFRALLPCLMFYNVYSADLDILQPRLPAFLVVFVLLIFGAGSLFYTKTQPDHRRRGAYIQNCFRSNIAVIGVSLAQSMMSPEGVVVMAIMVSTLVPLYNVLAVVTLETCRGGQVNGRQTLMGILRNPLIVACFLGFLCLAFQIHLPVPVEKAVSSIGSAGSVTTLLALGASFQFGGVGKNLRALVHCCLVRLVLVPALAVAAALALGFRGDALGAVLVCMGAPAASTSYPMALACDSDHELTAHVVVTTSLLCSLTLFLWIFLLKQLGLL